VSKLAAHGIAAIPMRLNVVALAAMRTRWWNWAGSYHGV